MMGATRSIIPTATPRHDYSVAGFWLNWAKFLLAFGYSYQLVVFGQLGISIPSATRSYLLALVSSPTSVYIQTITPVKDQFIIPFVPVTLDHLKMARLHITKVALDSTVLISEKTVPPRLSDPFPIGGSDAEQRRAVHWIPFNMTHLLGYVPRTGTYQITYCLDFLRDDGSRADSSDPAYVGLTCVPEQIDRFGDLPVWRGDECDFPSGLKEMLRDESKDNQGNAKTTYRVLKNDDGEGQVRRKGSKQAEPLPDPKKPNPNRDASITIDNARQKFIVTQIPCWDASNSSNNYWELQTSYKKGGKNELVTIGFVVRRCKQPVPTAAVYNKRTVLWYPKDLYETDTTKEKEYYKYFYLDRFIIDPDGEGSPRPSNVSIVPGSGAADYYKVENQKNEWRLRITQRDKVAQTEAGDTLTLNVSGTCGQFSNIVVNVQRGPCVAK
jgi:hypothetical protein